MTWGGKMKLSPRRLGSRGGLSGLFIGVLCLGCVDYSVADKGGGLGFVGMSPWPFAVQGLQVGVLWGVAPHTPLAGGSPPAPPFAARGNILFPAPRRASMRAVFCRCRGGLGRGLSF